MMNDETLRGIEYLREKADVSYEEAERVLQENGGNVMRALVALEQQGRVHQQPHDGENTASGAERQPDGGQTAGEKAETFARKAFRKRIVVEKKRQDGTAETVVNLSVPVAIGATIIAPYVALGSAIITFACGYHVRMKESAPDQ